MKLLSYFGPAGEGITGGRDIVGQSGWQCHTSERANLRREADAWIQGIFLFW